MAKRWKVIRQTLAGVGYTSITSVADITITSMDSDGTLYYTDEFGDAVKVLYPSATPIVVNSDTHSITISVNHVYLAGVSGYTATVTSVKNEHNLNVLSECLLTSSDVSKFTTGGTYGATLTAVATGSATLRVIHNDYNLLTNPNASGTTAITVGQVNTILSASGGTLDAGATGAFQVTGNSAYTIVTAITFKNQLNQTVSTSTANLYFNWVGVSGTVKTYIDASWAGPTRLLNDSTIQFNRTGVANLIIYDYNAKALTPSYTGVTYVVTMV